MMRWPLITLLLLLALPGWAAPTYEGPVIAVTDGDTIRVLYKDGQLKVRLAEIDTPEKSQPYGSRARQELAAMCFQKEARVVEQDRDRYGRIVGRVYCAGVDANAEMVRRGAAWVYRKYARDKSLYRLEQEAKTARRGLWALPDAQRVAPWEWRHVQRESKRQEPSASTPPTHERTPAAAPAVTGPGFQCGSKRTCKQMASCAEARFYLKHCGLTRLDGDRDGVPCEVLCKSK